MTSLWSSNEKHPKRVSALWDAAWDILSRNGASPRIHAGEGALERSVKQSRLSSRAFPDFLCSLVAPARFLRLSLTKAAYAVALGKPGLALGNAKPS